MDKEKVHPAVAREARPHLHDHLFLGAGLALLSRDLDRAALSGRARLVLQRAHQRLVSARDHLMDGKLDTASEVMPRQILHIPLIVDIVHLHLEVLPLLKVILHVKALDPGRIQVVHDDLCHAQFLPCATDLLVEDNHAIGSREGVQIGKIFTGETQTDGLAEALVGTVDVLVDGGQDGVVQITPDTLA